MPRFVRTALFTANAIGIVLCAAALLLLWTAPPNDHPVLTFLALLTLLLAALFGLNRLLPRVGIPERRLAIQCHDIAPLCWVVLVLFLTPLMLYLCNLLGMLVQGWPQGILCTALSYAWYLAACAAEQAVNASDEAMAKLDAAITSTPTD